MENLNIQQQQLAPNLKNEGLITYFTQLTGKEQRSLIKQLENLSLSKGNKPEPVKGLVIDRFTKHKGGKYMKFFVLNIYELDFNTLILQWYNLLYSNTNFKTFSRNKILDFKGKVGSKYVLVSKDCRISNLTTQTEFTRIVKREILDRTSYYPSLEVIIWKLRFKSNKTGLLKTELLI